MKKLRGNDHHRLAHADHCVGASRVALVVKSLPANAGDTRDVALIPGSGRSPGEGNRNYITVSLFGNRKSIFFISFSCKLLEA